MTFKLPFWATFFTIFAVLILCALGTWQIQRLAWKNDIITQLDETYKTQGKTLDFSTMKDNNYTYGNVTGTFLFDQSIALGHRVNENSIAGHSLITPLQTNQGILLVNLGFSPNDTPIKNHPLKAYQGQKITFTGLARSPSWNVFTPENDPQNDIWYRYDINQIAITKDLKNPIPFILYADKASPAFENTPYPNNELWYPNNNHAQYAFFWFALALTLIIIYVLRFFTKVKKN